ncbi:hypothetical protein SUGI_0817170 [Cryptomeria japonica]|nr:hypothetical protein SUGI_0817170 [Cryptomeria japonica]
MPQQSSIKDPGIASFHVHCMHFSISWNCLLPWNLIAFCSLEDRHGHFAVKNPRFLGEKLRIELDVLEVKLVESFLAIHLYVKRTILLSLLSSVQ